ncbi:MAG: hypothetical protein IPJ56_06935 [Gemmatimonadetes bacterium]|nr:hypothetical protein [Gemmatimonadota bacterium]
MKSLRFLALAFAAGLLAACGGEGVVTPPAVIAPPSLASAAATPTFLPSDPTAPAIANPVISFWAKRGVDQTVFMYYASRPGAGAPAPSPLPPAPRGPLAFVATGSLSPTATRSRSP